MDHVLILEDKGYIQLVSAIRTPISRAWNILKSLRSIFPHIGPIKIPVCYMSLHSQISFTLLKYCANQDVRLSMAIHKNETRHKFSRVFIKSHKTLVSDCLCAFDLPYVSGPNSLTHWFF